jgi:hypothetical protein
MRALAELHDAELRMLWEPCLTCPAHFEDLFEPVCPTISPEEITAAKGRSDTKVVAGDNAGNSPQKYGKGPAFTTAWMSYVGALRPRAHILKQVDEFQSAVWGEHVVGVHVRRTDAVIDRKQRLNLTFSDEPIMAAMQREIDAFPHTRFLFATDNEDSLRKYQHTFGERLDCYPKRFEKFDPNKHPDYGAKNPLGHRHTSVEDAVVDLWLLSRTKHIIGTKASSYSQYAAWLGKIPLQRL